MSVKLGIELLNSCFGLAQALIAVFIFGLVPTSSVVLANSEARSRPNIVLVMIDDMGYGDLTSHGSPFIKTAQLDRLRSSSIRLTNFHVAPMCSPTRGQLLSGLDAMRNGSTTVVGSRMMVREEIPLLPNILARAGYSTGVFGKWHLGETFPHRPQDRGFHHTLTFAMQEIGAFSDHWCNDYFDPFLRVHDGSVRQFKGFCTDIFFEQAIEWMQNQMEQYQPFFCYLPLNVVHSPQWAPRNLRERIAAQFPNLSRGQVGYLAMLANADINMGRLQNFLEESGQADNTLLIFLSDNGGYALVDRYNAGMRGGKSRLTEGGHRVPCFLRLPNSGLGGSGRGRNVGGLTQVQDLLPTILELCHVPLPDSTNVDGISLVKALRGQDNVPDRTLIVQYGLPRPFRMTCVMQGPWRLLSDIRGTAMGEPELYNVDSDPMQRKNLINQHPERAKQLRDAYDRWWAELEEGTKIHSESVIGHRAQESVDLSCALWRTGGFSNVAVLREGDIQRSGVWDVRVEKAATYEFALRRWPLDSGLNLGDPAPAWRPRDVRTPDHAGYGPGKALRIASARLRVGETVVEVPVKQSDKAAVIRLPLEKGSIEVEAFFKDAQGKLLCPAFFVTIHCHSDNS